MVRSNGLGRPLRNSDWKTPCGTAGARDMVPGSCEEIPERVKASRAETQRRRGGKETKAFICFESQRHCVSARDCSFFHTFLTPFVPPTICPPTICPPPFVPPFSPPFLPTTPFLPFLHHFSPGTRSGRVRPPTPISPLLIPVAAGCSSVPMLLGPPPGTSCQRLFTHSRRFTANYSTPTPTSPTPANMGRDIFTASESMAAPPAVPRNVRPGRNCWRQRVAVRSTACWCGGWIRPLYRSGLLWIIMFVLGS